ncbi:hypothetical protein [Bradyrhizobium sp. URHD0069]|uniref:hypothetical protein n=1 Tax=Bradyrhizobium sp. URHD0069 TaxID=1380355 RepID=UPI0004963617|nr:hypothetical protein [Bradyrhizobium sp. URHD0069]
MALGAIANAALDDHLPVLRDGFYAERNGWEVDINWETGLCHVRLRCAPPNATDKEVRHEYMLRLSFDYYPREQPGVIFVNPATREIGSSGDFERWWPNVDGNPWINIQINTGDPSKSYLCFQWTQEFKQTHAAPEQSDPKKWDPQKHTVASVVNMVQRALSSVHYKGFRKQ